MHDSDQLTFLEKFYPEVRSTGFTSVDGTIEFYGRVNALLDEEMQVLDFGAGRGEWFEDDKCAYRKELRLIKGKVRNVTGCDLDSAVLRNRTLDDAFVLTPAQDFPLDENSIDLIVADYVFEHVDNPEWLSREFHRVLKQGGWICARTPSKWSYVALAAKAFPNRRHSTILQYAQPERKEIDVFPTKYKLNSAAEIRRRFPADQFDDFSYLYAGEPAYHFNSAIVFRILQLISRLLPKTFHANLFVFLRQIDRRPTTQ